MGAAPWMVNSTDCQLLISTRLASFFPIISLSPDMALSCRKPPLNLLSPNCKCRNKDYTHLELALAPPFRKNLLVALQSTTPSAIMVFLLEYVRTLTVFT